MTGLRRLRVSAPAALHAVPRYLGARKVGRPGPLAAAWGVPASGLRCWPPASELPGVRAIRSSGAAICQAQARSSLQSLQQTSMTSTTCVCA